MPSDRANLIAPDFSPEIFLYPYPLNLTASSQTRALTPTRQFCHGRLPGCFFPALLQAFGTRASGSVNLAWPSESLTGWPELVDRFADCCRSLNNAIPSRCALPFPRHAAIEIRPPSISPSHLQSPDLLHQAILIGHHASQNPTGRFGSAQPICFLLRRENPHPFQIETVMSLLRFSLSSSKSTHVRDECLRDKFRAVITHRRSVLPAVVRSRRV